MSLSTTKTKYISMTKVVKEALWLKGLTRSWRCKTKLSLSSLTVTTRYNYLRTRST